MPEKHIGKVVQVMGPVLDIRFADGELPELLNAIELQNNGKPLIVEVAQHIGDNVVRCIAMAATDGLVRGAEAVDTGEPIKVPVGDQCLGRVFNLLGEPVSITVNFAGPVASGDMRIEAVAVRTNRSTQHWTVSMGQRNAEGEYEICTTATVITAVRRETFSMDSLDPPAMPDPATCERYDTQGAMEWLHRYDMRVVQGAIPTVWDDSGQESISQLWVRDDPPRPLDFPALAALCDVFFPRIWLQRARRVPAGTVGMTVYFHAGSEQLAQQADRHVLAQASAQAFRNGYFDQTAQLWDAEGSLLATSHQIVYYKE